MNKLNPLLLAMNDIDDSNIITNTKKRHKKLPIIIAAAAVLTVITGAAVVGNRYPKTMTINGEPTLKYNYEIMESVKSFSHEEMLAMGAEIIQQDRDGFVQYSITALPSEIFATFNMPSRINDNFIEEESAIKIDCAYLSEQPEEIAAIFLDFSLVDKNTGKTVEFDVDCTRSEHHVLNGLGVISEKQVDDETHYQDVNNKVLTLKNGSQAVVYKFGPYDHWYASFAYDGLLYTDVEVDSSDYDDIITVLTDLGVL